MGKFSSLLKLKPYMKKHWLVFLAASLGMILSSVVGTPVPYIIGRIMDKVLLRKGGYRELYIYIGVIAVLYIVRYIVSFTSKYMFSKISSEIVNEVRYSVVDKVLELPMDYLSNTEKGYVQGRISECSSVGSVFSSTMVGIVLSIFDAALALITMFVISYKLAFVVVLMVPVFFFSAKISAKKFMENTRQVMESSAFLNGEVFEIINGVEDIKVLNGKESNLGKFKKKLDGLVKISIKQSKSIVLFVENIGLINDFGSLIILLISGVLILKGQFTIGLYTSFSLYIARVFSSTQGLATIGTTIKPVCLSIERIYELLEMKDENEGRTKNLKDTIENIKLDKVDFGYKADKKVLNSISFEIRKGESVLIKGENGSGKSTLIKLLLGLYKKKEGSILYNGIDIDEINIKSLRARIGVVSQNIFLFKGTVLENILYGQKNITRSEVEELIESLDLKAYVDRLQKGIDTEINQNNSGVSGGQTQIIAFIRAMLSNKDIVILDEPISNVDSETREIILKNLKKRNFDGILIVVSHLIEGMDFIDKVVEI